jgi:hypothetical protein
MRRGRAAKPHASIGKEAAIAMTEKLPRNLADRGLPRTALFEVTTLPFGKLYIGRNTSGLFWNVLFRSAGVTRNR